MRVIFMGTPEFSVPALREIAARHEVVAVYSQPPRAAGRGQKARPSAVQRVAEELGLPMRTPLSLRDAEAQREFVELQADVAVVVAYGLILPKEVLDAPRFGCLNIHASLLPRWRGAAPIHRAILAGDAETGVAIMQMEVGLDTGPVIAEARTPIGVEETTQDLHDRLSTMGAELVVSVLAQLPADAVAQPADGVRYAEKIDKSEARIDWTRSATQIDRQIRGLSPFPGAWCEIEGERVKLLRSRVVAGSGQAGEVLDGFRIACGEGAVEILLAQRSGKRPMQADDLLRGWKLPLKLA
ncbi:methionyl-tRNA formyltransferase [Paracoccus homiensis]|uniref:methionyl-tRNA formyltransferase n=1 Tax=Paracoccus homiensis TaxID=364199 RepID=UPI00398D358B